MSALQNTLTFTNASDAQFRAWAQGIHDRLAAAGFVQTADTGQIDLSTVTAPALATTPQGYEIWRFDDALQATAPIYFKIEYGSGVSLATNPGIWLTFGTGSDGSGGISGPASTRQAITWTAYATNPLDCYWSYDTGRFACSLGVGGTGASTSNCTFFAFERTKDASGNDTSTGLLVLWKLIAGGGTNVWGHMFWDRTIGQLNSQTVWYCFGQVGATGKNGTQVAVYPVFMTNNGPFLNPCLNALGYHNGDITAKSAVSFSMYGQSHTYMPIGSGSFAGTNLVQLATGATMMMRYD